MLWGLIGGGVGLIVLVLILCLCLCGGSVEFGMTVNDAHDAMLSNDFIAGNSEYDRDDDGASIIQTQYKGEAGDLGSCTVGLIFNQKNTDELFACGIATKADLEVVKEFVTDKLDAECVEYENPDYDPDYNSSRDIYLCENGTVTAVIEIYENEEYPEFDYISIIIGDESFMSGNIKDAWNDEIDCIKDN